MVEQHSPRVISHDSTSLQYYLTFLRLLVTDASVFVNFLVRFSQSHSSAPSAAPPSPSDSAIDLPTPVHYLFRFVEKLLIKLSQTARTPDPESTNYKRRQEVYFRKLVVIAMSILFTAILPRFGENDMGTDLNEMRRKSICFTIHTASIMILDIHAFSLPDSYQAPIDTRLNLIEQARDQVSLSSLFTSTLLNNLHTLSLSLALALSSPTLLFLQLEKLDAVGSADVVQVFIEKVNELANSCTLVGKEEIMGAIDGGLLQKLQQLSSAKSGDAP